jgi:Arc/MetJ-type ribon-helix-helix transcriptional regulator
MTTVTISFPEAMMEFVDAQVASKGYVEPDNAKD